MYTRVARRRVDEKDPVQSEIDDPAVQKIKSIFALNEFLLILTSINNSWKFKEWQMVNTCVIFQFI